MRSLGGLALGAVGITALCAQNGGCVAPAPRESLAGVRAGASLSSVTPGAPAPGGAAAPSSSSSSSSAALAETVPSRLSRESSQHPPELTPNRSFALSAPLAPPPREIVVYEDPGKTGTMFVVPGPDGSALCVNGRGRIQRVTGDGRLSKPTTLGRGRYWVTAASGTSDGDVFTAGLFESADFGGGPLKPSSGFDTALHGDRVGGFVARKHVAGRHVFSRSLDGNLPYGVLALREASVLFGAWNGAPSSAATNAPPAGPYLEALDARGQHVFWDDPPQIPSVIDVGAGAIAVGTASRSGDWAIESLAPDGLRLFRYAATVGPEEVHLAASNQRLFLGASAGPAHAVDFGGGFRIEPQPAIVVAAMSRGTQDIEWLRAVTFAEPTTAAPDGFWIELRSMGATPGGGVVVTGVVRGARATESAFPGGGSEDLFVLELDAAGRQQWAIRRRLHRSCVLGEGNVELRGPVVLDKAVFVALSCPTKRVGEYVSSPSVPGAEYPEIGENRSWLLGWARPEVASPGHSAVP